MPDRWQPVVLVDDPEHWDRGDPASRYSLPDLSELLRRPAWHRAALCASHEDPGRWFPARGQDLRPARDVCDGCPVQRQCLDAGLDEDSGVWGGTSVAQRRKLRRDAA